MGVVTMAYAHYPCFFGTLWAGLKPLAQSRPFVEQAQQLRELVEMQVVALRPTGLRTALGEVGYADRELEQIGAIIDVFSHGNYPYLLIATVVRLLLEGEEMAGLGDAPPFEGRHAPPLTPPLVLMEAHHADAPTRALYEDVKASLRLPFVNTDYRALARWPSYFALAWNGLKPHVATEGHETLCQAVHDAVVDVVTSELPNPGKLSSIALRTAAAKDAGVEEILRVARLFQWLLPGLVVNVAFFRAQMRE
jgi:hypothetical protein